MDYSSSEFWMVIIQFGILAVAILIATLLRRKLPFLSKSLLPTSVLAGFLLLILRSVGVLDIDVKFLETLTYHGIAIGFIALSLRIPRKKTEAERGDMVGAKSGALIVSCYCLQGVIGLIITLLLAYTFMPGMFKAAGILLPMGYGQGPGQANNIGLSYENLGFAGGRSFGLAIAAAGYLCACIVGVIYINIIQRKKNKEKSKGVVARYMSVTVDDFQDNNEIPVSESIDRFSIQFVLVIVVYLLTYLVSRGVDSLLTSVAPGVANTVTPLLWGFNFIIGSALAMLTRSILGLFKKSNIMTRQYQNNYLLSRISGTAFDVMIVAGIASIDIGDLEGLWVPFILLSIAGGVFTLLYLRWICKKLYPNYYYEGMTSMYGMMTGTISSGVLLLRELDPMLETPAANNLVIGSSFAIIFGIPMLLLVGAAPKSPLMTFIVLGLCAVYFCLLVLFILKVKRRKKPVAVPTDMPKTSTDAE